MAAAAEMGPPQVGAECSVLRPGLPGEWALRPVAPSAPGAAETVFVLRAEVQA